MLQLLAIFLLDHFPIPFSKWIYTVMESQLNIGKISYWILGEIIDKNLYLQLLIEDLSYKVIQPGKVWPTRDLQINKDWSSLEHFRLSCNLKVRVSHVRVRVWVQQTLRKGLRKWRHSFGNHSIKECAYYQHAVTCLCSFKEYSVIQTILHSHHLPIFMCKNIIIVIPFWLDFLLSWLPLSLAP